MLMIDRGPGIGLQYQGPRDQNGMVSRLFWGCVVLLLLFGKALHFIDTRHTVSIKYTYKQQLATAYRSKQL